MRVTALSVNVGASAGNRALVMELFSFVNLLFVVDPPLNGDRHIPQEPGVWELFSFVHGSGVEVYIRSGMVGLFEVVAHRVAGVSIGYYVKGTLNVLRCVYMRPALPKAVWDDETRGWEGLNIVLGDMNVMDLSWDVVGNSYGGWARRGAEAAG